MPETVNMLAHAEDVAVVREVTGGDVDVAVVLGSGLSAVGDSLEGSASIGFERLKGMRAPSKVAGHAGRIVVGEYSGKKMLVFEGRIHTYQGLSAYDVSYPSRLASALGASTMIVTNAAGGVAEQLRVGDIMVIADHLNLMGDNPLRGWQGGADGTPFISMAGAYDTVLAELAQEVAGSLGVTLKKGIYAALSGPSYETPAEVEALRRLGADAVGMSTVPEVIAARALGLRVLGVSVITNAAGGSDLSHHDVVAVTRVAGEHLQRMLFGILDRLPA